MPLKLVAFDVGHTLIDESIDAATFVGSVLIVVRTIPPVDVTPDFVISSLAELPALIRTMR